jgi:hypothetical protein
VQISVERIIFLTKLSDEVVPCNIRIRVSCGSVYQQVINAVYFLFVLGKYPERTDEAAADRPSKERGEAFPYKPAAQWLLKVDRVHVES